MTPGSLSLTFLIFTPFQLHSGDLPKTVPQHQTYHAHSQTLSWSLLSTWIDVITILLLIQVLNIRVIIYTFSLDSLISNQWPNAINSASIRLWLFLIIQLNNFSLLSWDIIMSINLLQIFPPLKIMIYIAIGYCSKTQILSSHRHKTQMWQLGTYVLNIYSMLYTHIYSMPALVKHAISKLPLSTSLREIIVSSIERD